LQEEWNSFGESSFQFEVLDELGHKENSPASPIEELERIFKVYDMTLLSREPPNRLVHIDGDVAQQIQRALVTLGYLTTVGKSGFTPEAAAALEKFINVSNFENKLRDDGTIWRSVLDYLMKEASLSEP
jgi:uncharacterized Ntn-hydrolase superfamily protein